MYVWLEVPHGYSSSSFALELLKKADVVVSPGTGFGSLGEGYVRVALIESNARIEEAICRMEKAGIKYIKS